MKKFSFKATFIIIMIIAILSFGLTGCDINIVVPENTGTVIIHLSGTYKYDIFIDGVEKLSNKNPGTYSISSVPVGYRTIEAIDIDGESYGYDSTTVNVKMGTNNVYLDPEPTTSTGTVYISVSGDWKYDIKMDGITKFTNKASGTYTLYSVSVGNHTFEAIDTIGTSFGYDSETKYIYSGSNYVYLYP